MFFIPFISFRTTTSANSGKILYNYSIALLDEVMKNNDAFVTEEDGERFTAIYVRTFMLSTMSIYIAKRHANTLAEALPVLKEQANICDLIAITGIKIFYPKIYKLIKADGAVLAGPISEAIYDDCKQQLQKLRVELDVIINVYDENSNNGNAIRRMLALLFPRLMFAYNNVVQLEEDYLDCMEKKRLCSDKHFELYFSVPYVTL